MRTVVIMLLVVELIESQVAFKMQALSFNSTTSFATTIKKTFSMEGYSHQERGGGNVFKLSTRKNDVEMFLHYIFNPAITSLLENLMLSFARLLHS